MTLCALYVHCGTLLLRWILQEESWLMVKICALGKPLLSASACHSHCSDTRWRGLHRAPCLLLLPSSSLPQWPLGKVLLGSSPLRCEVLRAARSRHRELHFPEDHRQSHRGWGWRGVGASRWSLSAWPCPLLQDLVLQVMCTVYGHKLMVSRDMSVSRPASCLPPHCLSPRQLGLRRSHVSFQTC